MILYHAMVLLGLGFARYPLYFAKPVPAESYQPGMSAETAIVQGTARLYTYFSSVIFVEKTSLQHGFRGILQHLAGTKGAQTN
jgi:hypothetical protein